MRQLDHLFDSSAVVVLTAPVSSAHIAALGPWEAAAVERAVEKRQREYATGRRLAREALRRCGIDSFELLNGDDRAPIWPPAISGTITHSDHRAVVAVGLESEIGTLGIDIEHRRGLKRSLWRMTLLPEEQAYLETLDASDREAMALVIFSAKEALYKAQYPRSREYMEFFALRVEVLPDPAHPTRRGDLRCIFQRAVGPFADRTEVLGRYLPIDPHEIESDVLTAIQIER